MPLDAENRAESLKVLCNGNALKLRMEARCRASVQELAARDRLENVPLGADVLEAIDSLNGVAENGDFGDEGTRHHERLRQLLEAEPEERRSAEFYVVYSRVLRPTAGVEAEADALRRALDLDPRSGEIGLYLTGALKRLGRPTQEIEAVYRHVIANADDRSVKDMLPMDHYAARATEFLAELPSLAKRRELLALAEQGDRDAQYSLGSDYDARVALGVAENERQAAFWYRKAAEQGHMDAQFELGMMYANGRGVAEDDREAMFWYREAAEQGDVSGQYNLAAMYANGGEGIPVDGRQAVFWYRKAAEQGFASAQYNVAVLYDEGERIPKDDDQAVFWYRKAAEQGHANAQYNLGLMYENGEGVPKDHRQAVFWVRKAAENGSAWSQTTLGSWYYNGKGVAKDDGQAVFWSRKAAERGQAQAQNNLGQMYANGEGVPEDDGQAVLWFRKAAEQGHAQAQSNLGAMYAIGEGVAEDKVQAYAWFSLAAMQGHEDARRHLAFLRQYMTSAQLAEAQEMNRRLGPPAVDPVTDPSRSETE